MTPKAIFLSGFRSIEKIQTQARKFKLAPMKSELIGVGAVIAIFPCCEGERVGCPTVSKTVEIRNSSVGKLIACDTVWNRVREQESKIVY